MAACKKCGKAVGCGCNLNKNSLCASCARGQITTPVAPTPPPKPKEILKLVNNRWEP